MEVRNNNLSANVKNQAQALEAVEAKLNSRMDGVMSRMDGFETEMRSTKESIEALTTSLFRKEVIRKSPI